MLVTLLSSGKYTKRKGWYAGSIVTPKKTQGHIQRCHNGARGRWPFNPQPQIRSRLENAAESREAREERWRETGSFEGRQAPVKDPPSTSLSSSASVDLPRYNIVLIILYVPQLGFE